MSFFKRKKGGGECGKRLMVKKILTLLLALVACILLVRLAAGISERYYKSSVEETKDVAVATLNVL